ncbi:MAG: DUF4492 domain-containing protein [Bacteroidota bacterium]
MKINFIKKIALFYYEGFRNSTLGKKLLILLMIKLIMIFFVIRIFFFQNFLNTRFNTEKEKGDYVIEQLTNKKQQHDGQY